MRDMISQTKISVTTQFRFFVYPPLKAEFSQVETCSLDQKLGTTCYLLSRFGVHCIMAICSSSGPVRLKPWDKSEKPLCLQLHSQDASEETWMISTRIG